MQTHTPSKGVYLGFLLMVTAGFIGWLAIFIFCLYHAVSTLHPETTIAVPFLVFFVMFFLYSTIIGWRGYTSYQEEIAHEEEGHSS